ncbi:MAG: amidohydrolase family protein [Candidatus Lokiarchaeota archaeon]|nr:amidohydrolase family protein [Candidatus Lokiarchaeota archaeon]MBD3339026.1 amidohydrolase family protein [Candidatus Lokiarchaeota archaeon]
MNAQKIFYNGSIITMSETQKAVEAVAIDGEHIKAVGALEEVKNILGSDAELVNLHGRALLPGFIDSHMHPIMYIFFLFNLDLSDVRSVDELERLIFESSEKKQEGEWILGLRLNEENFKIPEERKLPTRWDLDKACSEKPVFIVRYDGHIGIANSLALELANIDEKTKIPGGGEIRKNTDGELTGIISEEALDILYSKISLPGPEEIMDTSEQAFKNLASKGITSIHGLLEYDRARGVEFSIAKAIQDKVLQNWYCLINTITPKKLKRLKKPPLDNGKRESRFKIGGLKTFADGTFGAATACMFEPFTDQPDKCGFCVVEEGKLYEQMVVAHKLGFQIGIHTIGDKGNRLVVDLYNKLLNEYPRDDHRHRIEHASILTPDVIEDIQKLNLIASCQPSFLNSEYNWLEKRLGKERLKYTYPYKSLIEAGIKVAAGSDCPVEVPDVIMGLHALVTRNGLNKDECIPVYDALKMYTINGAFAAFEEDIKGTIESGKYADLVILDKNPLKLKDHEIKHLQVIETIVRGKTIYKKERD